jgi:hypothetical protein
VTRAIDTLVAALLLGIGLAGEPLAPLRALLAAAILAAAAPLFARQRLTWVTFATLAVAVIVTCALQHGTVYPVAAVVALVFALLCASRFGRTIAPGAIASVGAVAGALFFFFV